jgi:hypothetical protein
MPNPLIHGRRASGLAQFPRLTYACHGGSKEGAKSRNWLPRKHKPIDLRSLCRAHTARCINALAGIVSCEDMPAAARVAAASALLDRGWGRVQQAHDPDALDGKIIVEIVYRGERNGDQAKVIEHPLDLANGRNRERR